MPFVAGLDKLKLRYIARRGCELNTKEDVAMRILELLCWLMSQGTKRSSSPWKCIYCFLLANQGSNIAYNNTK